jgi:hypothetical protein
MLVLSLALPLAMGCGNSGKLTYSIPGGSAQEMPATKGVVTTKSFTTSGKSFAAHSITFASYEDVTKAPAAAGEAKIVVDVRGAEGSAPGGPLATGSYGAKPFSDLTVLAVTGIQIQTFKDGAVKYDDMGTDAMKGALQITESGETVKGSIDATGPQGEGKGEITVKGDFSGNVTK